MNFEEISKKVKQFGIDTMTEVQKLNEVRQLNGRINDEKKKITQTYTEMGKRIYELYKETPLEGFEADIEVIEECIRMIDLLQDQIRTVKGVVLCPCCNMEVNVTEKFCSNCGNKMPEVFTIEEETAAESVIETEENEAAEAVEEAAAEVEDEPTAGDLAAEAEAMEAEFDAVLAAEEAKAVEAEEVAEAVEADEEVIVEAEK